MLTRNTVDYKVLTYFLSMKAFVSWLSCNMYLNQMLNQFTAATIIAYIVGILLQALFYLDIRRTFEFEQFSRACLAFAASYPFVKVLRLLSIHRYIGPRLQMIRKMVRQRAIKRAANWLSDRPISSQ